MIAKLRLRLTIICAAMTSIVLVCLMAVLVMVAEKEYKVLNLSLFHSALNQVTYKLLSESEIENKWLSQMESSNHIVLSIEDNTIPIFFNGSWMPGTDRGVLIQKAHKIAEDKGFDRMSSPVRGSLTEQIEYTMSGSSKDEYRCAVVLVSASQGFYCLTMISDLNKENMHIQYQRIMYSLITAAGILLFIGISWVLAGIAIRPVEKNIEQQNLFVASASHELRSPLAMVATCASAVLVDHSKTEDYIYAITKECGRLGRLVDDLLLLANSGIKNWNLKKDLINLDTLLIETIEQLVPMAEKNQHMLVLDLPDEETLPPVYGDSERMKQAVINLVINAVCYSGKQCLIEVRGYRAGHFVSLDVIDHGVGIPDDSKDKIFNRFYQVNKSRSNKSHFGLGLSITQEIIRLHGGKITLKNTLDGGCTFSIVLPGENRRGRQSS